MKKKLISRRRKNIQCKYLESNKCLYLRQCFGCPIIDAIIKENEMLREKLSKGIKQ
jgi:hypothetical protein